MQIARKEAMQEIEENGFEKSQIRILALLTRLRQICCHPSLFLENYKGESSKLNQCIEIVKDAIQAGHKILLFSGYTSMFEIIEKELKKNDIKYFKLTGQTKVGERIQLVDEFNESPNVKIFQDFFTSLRGRSASAGRPAPAGPAHRPPPGCPRPPAGPGGWGRGAAPPPCAPPRWWRRSSGGTAAPRCSGRRRGCPTPPRIHRCAAGRCGGSAPPCR